MIIKTVLDSGATMPRREHPDDAGMDLFSREEFCLWPGGHHTFDIGVHMDIPSGYQGKIESKSGLNTNDHIVTCGGTIDAGYTGSITVTLYNLGKRDKVFKPGQKIAQLVISPIVTPDLEEVTALPKTERGDNGFGSTGEF